MKYEFANNLCPSHDISPIFALATPNIRSALHLHRLSGFGIFDLISPYIFTVKSELNLNLKTLANSKCVSRYVKIKNKNGDILDDAMLTLFPSPNSFTGEDIIEFCLHGSPYLSMQFHSFLRSIGFREAKPGEFTQRAVLNGKLDLAQAEGIHQLIQAENQGAVQLARNNMEGILSKETIELRTELIHILSYLEAHIDFAPDEVGDYHPKSLLPKLLEVKNKLTSLYSSYENGLKIKEGLKIVLCGKPNAGKSSLYNSLLKQERAIVTDIPGTTRDVLRDALLIDGKEFILLDTAGIRETDDVVEKIGVERSLNSIAEADIICYLIDGTLLKSENLESQIEDEVSTKLSTLSENKKLAVIITKSDLLNKNLLEQLSKISFVTLISISTYDFLQLKKCLIAFHDETFSKTNVKESAILISKRQQDKVEFAIKYLHEAEILLNIADFPEKIASLINLAKASLEEIVGEISLDSIYDSVFSSFCIGK